MSRKFMITVNGNSYEVDVEEIGGGASTVASAPVENAQPKVEPKAAPAPAPKAASAAGGKKVAAPMPGTVVKANVKAGDSFSKGDVLVIIEAMKMENEITAPEDGVVADVPVTAGASVDTGAALVIYN